jgi:hypothetical protein
MGEELRDVERRWMKVESCDHKADDGILVWGVEKVRIPFGA